MIDRDRLVAELNAAKVLEAHGPQIRATIFADGRQATANTLRALASLIERGEFRFRTEWMN